MMRSRRTILLATKWDKSSQSVFRLCLARAPNCYWAPTIACWNCPWQSIVFPAMQKCGPGRVSVSKNSENTPTMTSIRYGFVSLLSESLASSICSTHTPHQQNYFGSKSVCRLQFWKAQKQIYPTIIFFSWDSAVSCWYLKKSDFDYKPAHVNQVSHLCIGWHLEYIDLASDGIWNASKYPYQ